MDEKVLARWYLVQTKPHQEARAEQHLQRQNFECFRPLCRKRARSTSDVLKEESLFPGYLFIHLDQSQQNWLPISSTRGVSRIVSFGGRPTPVRDEIIAELRDRLATIAPIEQSVFSPGDKVRFLQSELSSVDAIFLSPDGTERSVILLRLLQREHTLSVSTRQLARAN